MVVEEGNDIVKKAAYFFPLANGVTKDTKSGNTPYYSNKVTFDENGAYFASVGSVLCYSNTKGIELNAVCFEFRTLARTHSLYGHIYCNVIRTNDNAYGLNVWYSKSGYLGLTGQGDKTSSKNIADMQWHKLAIATISGNARIYVDGQFVIEHSRTGSGTLLQQSNYIGIGNFGGYGYKDRYSNCCIRNVACFNNITEEEAIAFTSN